MFSDNLGGVQPQQSRRGRNVFMIPVHRTEDDLDTSRKSQLGDLKVQCD